MELYCQFINSGGYFRSYFSQVEVYDISSTSTELDLDPKNVDIKNSSLSGQLTSTLCTYSRNIIFLFSAKNY